MSAPPAAGRGYAAGARVLSIGIASTGLVTFAYFALASHALGDAAYARISLLWSVLFVTVSVVHRPVEQLLARTIAADAARGARAAPLRTPILLQAAFVGAFLVAAIALRGTLTRDVLGGSDALFAILIAAVVAYGASYVARGWLAGHRWFALYGGLVFLESTSRCLFAAAAVLGIAHGEAAVALGMAAAPLVSLIVVPAAFRRRPRADAAPRGAGLELARGGRFAVAVFAVMLAEQALLNAGVLLVGATAAGAAAGFAFNALLVARAPLQLFQAVQTSLLPHLSAARVSGDERAIGAAVRTTLLGVAGFAALVTAGLAAVGPSAMHVLFGDGAPYARWGLAAVGAGMGLHLAAGTLTQAAYARDRAGTAAAVWLVAAIAFAAFVAAGPIADPLTRVEVGYAGAAGLLAALLALSWRAGTRAPRGRGGGPRPSA